MKGLMKLPLCLILTTIIMTFVTASRPGEKIHFQDSSEVGEFDVDNRFGHGRGHGNRNHRGRGRGHHKHGGNVAEFEEGIPGVYPIRGPPQAPLVLPSHPGRGVGLQKNKFAQDNVAPSFPPVQTPNNLPLVQTPNNLPPVQSPNNLPPVQSPTSFIKYDGPVFSPQPQQLISQQVQEPLNNPFASNPFLSNIQTASVIPTNKYNTQGNQGVTNQLPTSDKPATTTPSYANPRRTDLLYGSNLLEEQDIRQGKSEDTTDVNFGDRGLFDTAPHCQNGQILVNNKCRVAV